MTDLKDSQDSGIKIYRDSSADVDRQYKAHPKGVEVTAQSNTTGEYTVGKTGDEAGWLFTAELTPGVRDYLGSWCQAYPAILRTSDGKIVPIKDKSQAVSTAFKDKTQSSVAGDSSDLIRVAETDTTGIPGVVVTCLNGDAQEQLFLPASEILKVDQTGYGNVSTKVYDISVGGAINPANI